MLVILGRLSKCITIDEIIQFGKRHLKRFQSMGMLLRGIPSEATLCRVFKSIDDEQMAARMADFVDIFRKELPGWNRNIISVDGKALRGTVYKNGRNLEKQKMKSGRQEKRDGRTDKGTVAKLYQATTFFSSKMRQLKF